MVHIREYVKKKNGFTNATENGLMLNPTQLATLVYNSGNVSRVLRQIQNGEHLNTEDGFVYSTHLDDRYVLTVDKNCSVVDIRRRILSKNGDVIDDPKAIGIALRFTEWFALTRVLSKILTEFPELKDFKPYLKPASEILPTRRQLIPN